MLTLPPISFSFYQRMNPRERMLSLLVAGTLFIIANLIALNFLFNAFHDLGAQYAANAQDLRQENFWASSQPLWQQRSQWLREKQPILTNRDRASTQLLEQVQGAARAAQVLLRSQQPRALAGASPEKEYQPVSAHFETESDWKQLVSFLSLLQKPENFIVFDLASVHTDPNDATRMRCTFDVSKWDAPAGH